MDMPTKEEFELLPAKKQKEILRMQERMLHVPNRAERRKAEKRNRKIRKENLKNGIE